MEKKELSMSHDIKKGEDIIVQNIEVNCIAEEGLGFGEGTISSAEVDTDVLKDVLAAIDSEEILVKIPNIHFVIGLPSSGKHILLKYLFQ